jgi:hypothetical protein
VTDLISDTCDLCHRRAYCRFVAAGHRTALRCRWHALVYGPVFHRSLRVAMVVGTILFLINQADVVVGGHLTVLVAAKIALTYLVPFSVSTYSALQINRLGQC